MKIPLVIASLLLMLTAPVFGQNAPNLKDSLQWIRNTLQAGGGQVIFGAKGEISSVGHLSMSYTGCEVDFVYTTINGQDGKETLHPDTIFNLKDIDPQAILSSRVNAGFLHLRYPMDLISIETTNDARVMMLKMGLTVVPTSDMTIELNPAYAPKFLKAFKHAVALCGGKSSTF
jgi:hypothetical protein